MLNHFLQFLEMETLSENDSIFILTSDSMNITTDIPSLKLDFWRDRIAGFDNNLASDLQMISASGLHKEFTFPLIHFDGKPHHTSSRI